MKLTLIAIIISFSTVTFAENLFCHGPKCIPYNKIENSGMGSGLSGLKKEQVDKTSGVNGDKGYNFNAPHEKTETGYGLKLHEVSVGTCLIDPKNPDTYAKIMRIEKDTGLVEFIVEKEEHDYMLAWNFVSWNLPDSASLKNMRIYSCDRTPHLGDNGYLKKCGVFEKRTASGKFYCQPPKRF